MTAPWLALVESNTSGTGRLFVRAAARLGLRPVLLTNDPSRYKYTVEDALHVLRIDTADEKALFGASQRLACADGLAGVTSSSEYFIMTAARLARRLGLPGPNPDAIRACRDKRIQRFKLQAAGVGVPDFRVANTVKRSVDAARELGFPVIVKPVSGTGSVGVKLCQNEGDVAGHAEALLKQRRNERGMAIPHCVLVEELAVGPEYSVETFGTKIIGITQKHLGPLPFFVEVGHDYPAALSPHAQALIHETVSRVVRVLGLGWGPSHLELRLVGQGVKVIEVNPRLAGGYIPELVRLACGTDLITQTVSAAAGRPPQIAGRIRRFAAIRFLLAPGQGILTKVHGVESARRVAGIEDVQLYLKRGDRIQQHGDFRDRIGHVIAAGDSAEQTQAAVESARDLIRPFVRPSLAVTEKRANSARG